MNRKRDTVVLGQELADAKKAEASRIAKGPGGQSPMPPLQYNEESGDFNLESVNRLPIDEKLRIFTKAIREWEHDQREDARRKISMDEFYTLIHFAKRSAVIAISEGSTEPCENGLAALALIDETRIDQRDAAWAAGLLSYAVTATGGSRKALFDPAIVISTPGMGEILRGSAQSDDLSDWGFAEIRTDNGSRLIESDWAAYEPTLALDEIALTIAGRLNEERYVAHPKIAVEVPGIWFAEEFRAAAQSALERARGAIAINGKLRESYSDEAGAQMFVHWLAELPSSSEAEQLVTYLGSGSHLSGRFAVGYSVRRLFGLLVAGSTVAGIDPYESQESLADLVKPLQSLIRNVVSQRLL